MWESLKGSALCSTSNINHGFKLKGALKKRVPCPSEALFIKRRGNRHFVICLGNDFRESVSHNCFPLTPTINAYIWTRQITARCPTRLGRKKKVKRSSSNGKWECLVHHGER